MPFWVVAHHIIALVILSLIKIDFMNWSALGFQELMCYFEFSTIIHKLGIITEFMHDLSFLPVFIGGRVIIFNYIAFTQYITYPMNYDKYIMWFNGACIPFVIYQTSIYNLKYLKIKYILLYVFLILNIIFINSIYEKSCDYQRCI